LTNSAGPRRFPRAYDGWNCDVIGVWSALRRLNSKETLRPAALVRIRSSDEPVNHSAHISKETRAWVDAQPEGRFCFVFTPKHGSWLNLVEGFFSKMTRSMPRHIRVGSKAELKARIITYLDDLNRDPVVHSWTYKISNAA
jgi:hypothetical protein